MAWIDETVLEFGRGFGIDGASFATSSVVQFSFDRSGTLVMERAPGFIQVYLARRLTLPIAPGTCVRALDLCHYRHGRPFAYATGFIGDDTLAFLVRIPDEEFTLPTLQQAFEGLVELHHTLSG
ncbi:MAG: type III secretion chaperone SycN [Rhodospirillaceae bacterium]